MIIYKYQISLKDEQRIEMPKGAQVLHVGLDPEGLLCVWARVDTRERLDPVTIYCVMTGGAMSPGAGAAAYLGQLQAGGIVCHYFWTRRA